MSMQDPISDMITRIRNGQIANKISVKMPHSTLKQSIGRVLKEEGYIKDYCVNNISLVELEIYLKYFRGKPVIVNIKRISRPSLRIYKKNSKLPKIMDGLGIAIISTSKGLMTDHLARKMGLGGEIICSIA
ncbi:30S ribosomal protein S8 [Buchnera aphidicola (Eriosoma grossulariae)]|uniref:30S ribosomal protein S8 n=1 Tax=Buchnera aphidicola TaxID=9 RepID=UPI0034644D49